MTPAIQISELQATLDPEAAAQKQVRLRVHGGVLRLSPAGIAGLLPPHVPMELTGIREGRLLLRMEVRGIPVNAEVLPEGTGAGNLRLHFTSLKVAAFLPLPADTILGFLLPMLQSRLPRGIYVVEGRVLEINPGQLGEKIGLELPSLRRVTLTAEGAVLQF